MEELRSNLDINADSNRYQQLNADEASRRNGFNRFIRSFSKIIGITLITATIALFFLYVIPGIQEFGKGRKSFTINDLEFKQLPAYKKQIKVLEKDVQRLKNKLNAFTPIQPYIVISTTNNRFYLYQNKKLIREGFCSSGSYILLLTEGVQRWIFKTPKGKFRINSKMIDPVWKKPDWAFIEEGLPVPSENHDSRFEYGVLGDYALDFGDGYLIHGTLYKRFLGMPVTHGCVRLNDDDLEAIYKTLVFGSKVYIY